MVGGSNIMNGCGWSWVVGVKLWLAGRGWSWVVVAKLRLVADGRGWSWVVARISNACMLSLRKNKKFRIFEHNIAQLSKQNF